MTGNSDFCFWNIQTSSIPKSQTASNDDAFAANSACLVVADGVTKKTVGLQEGRNFTGGDVARRIVDCAVLSSNNGVALVSELNEEASTLQYSPNTDSPSEESAGCAFACLRISGDKLIITQVGDASVRINGGDIYVNSVLVDQLTSAARAHYIQLTGDIQNSREFILPLLQAQLKYRNNAAHPLGYGVIDGGPTPAKFILETVLDLSTVSTVEIFSDGYPEAPTGITIEDWEAHFSQITKQDPDRCREYPATKTTDDRTIIIAEVKAGVSSKDL